jgi:hypothetical protein
MTRIVETLTQALNQKPQALLDLYSHIIAIFKRLFTYSGGLMFKFCHLQKYRLSKNALQLTSADLKFTYRFKYRLLAKSLS